MSTPAVQRTDLEMGDLSGNQTTVENEPLAANVNIPTITETESMAPASDAGSILMEESIDSTTNASLTPQDHANILTDSQAMGVLMIDTHTLNLIGNMYQDNIQRAEVELVKHELIHIVARNEYAEAGLWSLKNLYEPLSDKLYKNNQMRLDLEYLATARRIHHEFTEFKTILSVSDPMLKREFEVVLDGALRTAILDVGRDGGLWNEAEISQLESTITATRSSSHMKKRIWGDFDDRARGKAQARQNFLSRLYMALFGGWALVSPMLIMTLHESKVTSLVTTSVFVIAVAVALAWFMKDAQPKDIIGATAAALRTIRVWDVLLVQNRASIDAMRGSFSEYVRKLVVLMNKES
ncbi:hypothetical protein VTL71DRAFT_12235 [Oculimacula yallundae]|uniref:Uncharacterized protein n=1 Tax=Oculimacula yallundae TaxID=86028 RepID=A0ABR4CSX9_9HELO